MCRLTALASPLSLLFFHTAIVFVMALTPKRLFLSLSASVSLFSALTLSSHAHLWSLKLSLLQLQYNHYYFGQPQQNVDQGTF